MSKKDKEKKYTGMWREAEIIIVYVTRTVMVPKCMLSTPLSYLVLDRYYKRLMMNIGCLLLGEHYKLVTTVPSKTVGERLRKIVESTILGGIRTELLNLLNRRIIGGSDFTISYYATTATSYKKENDFYWDDNNWWVATQKVGIAPDHIRGSDITVRDILIESIEGNSNENNKKPKGEILQLERRVQAVAESFDLASLRVYKTNPR
jgi:hypothetical protein